MSLGGFGGEAGKVPDLCMKCGGQRVCEECEACPAHCGCEDQEWRRG